MVLFTFLFLVQRMIVNGEDVTPPLATMINVPSCMICLQYRLHPHEMDIDARRRILAAWVERDHLLTMKRKYFLTLAYHDLKGNCDKRIKSIKFKREEDFPLTDMPVPGCQDVWFVKWERVRP